MRQHFWSALLGTIVVLGGLGSLLFFDMLPAGDDKPRLDDPVALLPAAERRQRPEFKLKDLQGVAHSITEWDGKVRVINFWATWCPPCREELPLFIKLQTKYTGRDVQFIGVAVDELQSVIDFTKKLAVNYPMLIGGMEAMAVTQSYGNNLGVLPFTAIVDRQQRIVFVRTGEVNESEMDKTLSALLMN